VPVPTPRQSRKPSVESPATVPSPCELRPPVSPDVLAKFDPLAVPVPEVNTAVDTDSTDNNLTRVDDVGGSQERDESKSSDEVDHYNGECAVDPCYNGSSQPLVSSTVHADGAHEGMELNLKRHFESASSTSDIADDDGKRVSSSGRQSQTYIEIWNLPSGHMQRPVETGLLPNTAVFPPKQREFIKPDESSTMASLSSASSDSEDMVFLPPLPKKRGNMQPSTPDASAVASDTAQSLAPSRIAPPPPDHDDARNVAAGSSRRETDEDVTVAGVEMAAAAASSPVRRLPATPKDDKNCGVEEQTVTMSVPCAHDMASSSAVGNISAAPLPRPRVSPRLPAVSNDYSESLSPSRKQLPLLVLPTAVHQPSSTPSGKSSPLDRVRAVGGVNILAMGAAATRYNSKTSTSSDVASPTSPRTAGIATPDSAGTPPVPPPKRKPSDIRNNVSVLPAPMDNDTTDDEAETSIFLCKDSKCLSYS